MWCLQVSHPPIFTVKDNAEQLLFINPTETWLIKAGLVP